LFEKPVIQIEKNGHKEKIRNFAAYLAAAFASFFRIWSFAIV
jgi:hypothetical protein